MSRRDTTPWPNFADVPATPLRERRLDVTSGSPSFDRVRRNDSTGEVKEGEKEKKVRRRQRLSRYEGDGPERSLDLPGQLNEFPLGWNSKRLDGAA